MNTTFGIGNVLGTGFKVWFRNIIPFLLITALFYSPLWLWTYTIVGGELTVERLQTMSLSLGMVSIAMLLVNLAVSAAVAYGVIMELHGQRASVGACLATGLSRFFPLLGVALLSALCIAGAALLLIVPGIIVFCMLYVATPAVVLERPGVMGALRRSRELTRGHRLGIFGLIVILGLLGWVLQLVINTIATPETSDPEQFLQQFPRTIYLNFIQQAVTGSLGAVMSSVTYYLLRAEKEGTSAAELAAVFE